MHGLEGNATHSGVAGSKGTSLSEYLKACANSQSQHSSDSSIVIRSQRHKHSEASLIMCTNKENYSPIGMDHTPTKLQASSKMFESQPDHEHPNSKPTIADSPPRSKLFISSADKNLFWDATNQFQQQEPQKRVKTVAQSIRASLQKLRTSQAELISQTGRVFFKIIVYRDKVETWQIDADGNTIPGGLLEVQYCEPANSTFPSERLMIQGHAEAHQHQVLGSEVLSIPLTRQSQEKFSELLAHQHRELQNIEQKLEGVRNSLCFEQPINSYELAHQEQQYERELERLEQAHLQAQQDLLKKEYEAFARAKKRMIQSIEGHLSTSPNLAMPVMVAAQTQVGQGKQSAGLVPTAPQQVVYFQNGLNPYVGQAFLNPGQKAYSDSVGPGMFESCLHEIRELGMHTQHPAQPMGRDELRADDTSNQQQKHGAHAPETGISRDFGDWLEKGVFTLIANDSKQGSAATSKYATAQRHIPGLSAIAETPEDRSESSVYSPIKAGGALTPQQSMYPQTQLKSVFDSNQSAFNLNHQRPNQSAGANGYAQETSSSSVKQQPLYAQCTSIVFEDVAEDRLGTSRADRIEESHVSQVPIHGLDFRGSRGSGGEAHPAESQNSNLGYTTQPSKIVGAGATGQRTISYKGTQYAEYAINEVRPDEEDEETWRGDVQYHGDSVPFGGLAIANRVLKEMTPMQSIDFQPHHINTESSVSQRKTNEEFGRFGAVAGNYVLPSLRFSSVKIDKSVQVRDSMNTATKDPHTFASPSKPDAHGSVGKVVLGDHFNPLMVQETSKSASIQPFSAFVIEPLVLPPHPKQTASNGVQVSPHLNHTNGEENLRSTEFQRVPEVSLEKAGVVGESEESRDPKAQQSQEQVANSKPDTKPLVPVSRTNQVSEDEADSVLIEKEINAEAPVKDPLLENILRPSQDKKLKQGSKRDASNPRKKSASRTKVEKKQSSENPQVPQLTLPETNQANQSAAKDQKVSKPTPLEIEDYIMAVTKQIESNNTTAVKAPVETNEKQKGSHKELQLIEDKPSIPIPVKQERKTVGDKDTRDKSAKRSKTPKGTTDKTKSGTRRDSSPMNGAVPKAIKTVFQEPVGKFEKKKETKVGANGKIRKENVGLGKALRASKELGIGQLKSGQQTKPTVHVIPPTPQVVHHGIQNNKSELISDTYSVFSGKDCTPDTGVLKTRSFVIDRNNARSQDIPSGQLIQEALSAQNTNLKSHRSAKSQMVYPGSEQSRKQEHQASLAKQIQRPEQLNSPTMTFGSVHSKGNQGGQYQQVFAPGSQWSSFAGRPAITPAQPVFHGQSDREIESQLRDQILNEFICSLCSAGILSEEACENENYFIENDAIMIGYEDMVRLCLEMGFLPRDFLEWAENENTEEPNTESPYAHYVTLLNHMWYILGGQEAANAVCIQDLSVFILAIFGLNLDCLSEEGQEDNGADGEGEMFNQEEVAQIQSEFAVFRETKCTGNIPLHNMHTTTIELEQQHPQEEYEQEGMIREEEAEEDEEPELQPNTYQGFAFNGVPYGGSGFMSSLGARSSNGEECHTGRSGASRGGSRSQRMTAKSRGGMTAGNPNDNSFISRNNPPKSQTSASPTLIVDVNLGGGKQERVVMYEGDDPAEIAARIVSENKLDPNLCNKFLRILHEQLNEPYPHN